MLKRSIAILAASCSTMGLAKDPGWTISESSGSVRIAHAGLTKIATRGTAVVAGDVVTTGIGARAVLVRGTEFMMVAPGSQLRVRLPDGAASAAVMGVTKISVRTEDGR